MVRASILPVLCGLLVLQSLLLQGAVEAQSVGGLGEVEIAWFPTTTCEDMIGDANYNCQKCNMAGSRCLICRPGYAFNAAKQCQRCTDRLCSNCGMNRGACVTCRSLPKSDPNSFFNAGFPTFINDQGVCRPCNDQRYNTGCLSCSTDGKECTKCDDGYYLLNGVCTKCSGGSMCKTCTNQGVCTKCKTSAFAPAFGLNAAKRCVRCASPQCVDCNADSTKCRKCANGGVGIGERGFGVDAAAGCSQCSDSLCGFCSTNSAKCWGCLSDDARLFYPYQNAAGKCTRGTVTGCLFYNKDGACRECDEGFIKTGVTCDKLPKCKDAKCADCRGNTSRCRTCIRSNYFSTTQKKCMTCSVPRCDKCSNGGRSSCLVCAKGYGLVHGKCLQCARATEADWQTGWCSNCDGNVKKCTRCFPPQEYVPIAGKCVSRLM